MLVRYIVEREGRILTVRLPPGSERAEVDGESFYELIEPHLHDGGPTLGVLHDLRFSSLTPARRKRFAEYVRTNEQLIARRVAAYAVVAPGALQHGFITAVLWIVRPPSPHQVFTDARSARIWLETRVRG